MYTSVAQKREAIANRMDPLIQVRRPPTSVPQDQDQDQDQEQDQETVPMTSVSSMPTKRGPGRPRKDGSAKPRQGYYVLENNGDGLHRYIYYGPDSPPGLA